MQNEWEPCYGVMICKFALQIITSEFEPYWIPQTCYYKYNCTNEWGLEYALLFTEDFSNTEANKMMTGLAFVFENHKTSFNFIWHCIIISSSICLLTAAYFYSKIIQ